MADPYIDQYETLIYGKYAREQMEKVCLGRVTELDGMVKFAIAQQTKADTDMKVVLDKQPKPASLEDAAKVLEEARDIVVRFGSYLNSLKGHPVSPRVFFRNENPSDIARKRLVKLAGTVQHIAAEIPKHSAITDPTWANDFDALSKKLEALKIAQANAKLVKADLGPEVAAQRDKWLAVYNANKLLVRGLFAHIAKPELLPHVFDDLAETHRAAGVSDDVPPAEGTATNGAKAPAAEGTATNGAEAPAPT